MKKRLLVITVALLVMALTLNVSSGFAATKKSVYVISSMTVKNISGSYTSSNTTKYTYNKNGLLKKYSNNSDTGKYTYNGKKLKTAYLAIGDGVPSDYKYTWKSGKIKKAKDSQNYITLKYKYNKSGKISKITGVNDYNGSISSETTYKYDSKKRLKSSLIGVTKTTYKYNSKGALSKTVQSSSNYTTTYNYKTTFKNGRITKIVKTLKGMDSYKVKVTIKYKKIKVPSNYLSLVKKQRKQIIMDHGCQLSLSYFPMGKL